MQTVEYIYNIVLNTVGYGIIPFVWKKSELDPTFFKGRLGRYEIHADQQQGRPRIWFHTVSVGEVTGAVPTLCALHERLPESSIFLSTGTPQGYHFAQAQLPRWVRVVPFPLDFPWILKRTFQSLQPDLYVAMESEFWPNLFRYLREREIPSILLNGRLSSRSAKRYALLKSLFFPIFRQFKCLGMHSEEDRQNILGLGVSKERTLVLGSSKYDGLLQRVDPSKTSTWREKLNLPLHLPVVVGGSLRRSECIQILEVFQSLLQVEPQAVGIFAPRHLERIPNMVLWLQERGIDFQMLSHLEKTREKRRASIVLVDRIGILFELYSLGDLIFCGGTLEPIGGHNILEPAAWRKPVFYGPCLQKVLDEHSILHSLQGSFPVRDKHELLQQWTYWIQHLPALKIHGEKAKEALLKMAGVADRQVEIIMAVLAERKRSGASRS